MSLRSDEKDREYDQHGNLTYSYVWQREADVSASINIGSGTSKEYVSGGSWQRS